MLLSNLAPGGASGKEWVSESHSVVSASLQPHELYSPRNSPGHNSGVGSLFLLQGIFPTQGSNPGLPYCRRILLLAEPQVVKNLPANAGEDKRRGSIPRWGRSPGGGQGNPLQASHLEKPMDKGAWWATIHMVAKSRTGPKQLSLHILPQIAGLNMPWTLGAILSLSRAFYDNTGFLVMCPQSFQH